MTLQVPAFPKSLQEMIADCRNAVANWDPDEEGDDPVLRSMRDWTLRLSRGEYEERLYWECVADDCEKAGDWEGALSAHRRILGIPALYGIDFSKACSAIASIQKLFGDDHAALKSYNKASEKSVDDSRILWRMRVSHEIWQLIRMGRIRRARKLIRQGLAPHQEELVDHLGTARMLIALAECELADNQTDSAAQSLQNGWKWLESLVHSYGDEKLVRQATGIQSTYVAWWTTEARRCRIRQDRASEITALENAIEKTRLCITPCDWQGPWNDLTLMNLLIRTADAYERQGMAPDATAFRKEAHEIFTKRRFPESAKWPRYDDWRPRRFSLLRQLQQIFVRRPNDTRDGKVSP